MAHLLHLKTFSDSRGNLSVFEDHEIPFEIKRVFYIYGVDASERGGHRHHKTRQALICLNGSCKIYNNDGKTEEQYLLDNAQKCLILEPNDWHKMYEFAPESVLLVFASAYFEASDYIYEPYDK